MSIGQQAINDLRNGNFSQIITLAEKIVEKYTLIYDKPIAQDELQQLLAYELVRTDISKDDLTMLHLLERLIDNGEIYSHLSSKYKANLVFTLTAFCTASSIKQVENYLDSTPLEVTRESIKEFLSRDSQFSELILNEVCKDSMLELQKFIMDNSDSASIRTLLDNRNKDNNNISFMTGLLEEKVAIRKINHLKLICNNYIQHIKTIIENYIKKNNIELFKRIFQKKVDITITDDERTHLHKNENLSIEEFLQNNSEELNSLMKNDSNFEIVISKYRAVSDMLNRLEDKQQNSQENLKSFEDTFRDNKNLLTKRRDSAGMTFLKGVTTVLSLGSVLLFKNFWKPESKKKSQEIESVLTAKM